jgi:hypothetical protein
LGAVPFRRLIVVCPTRNRPDLVRQTITSVTDQRAPDVELIVSDNSSDAAAAAEGERLCASRPGVTYVRPDPLPMAAHWEWALSQARERFPDASHVTYVTDRTLMRPDSLAFITTHLRAHPDTILSYNEDMVDDWTVPVELHQYEWTGDVYEVDAPHLLALSSRAVLPPMIPRMLNCVVPIEVFDRVREHFGVVFQSVAPDFAFAYRALALVDTIHYADRSLLIHHALGRSNGASYARGIESKDSADFLAQLPRGMNELSPVPDLRTSTNPVYHEYNLVRSQAGSRESRFPPIDRSRYFAAMAADVAQIEDPQVRGAMRYVLQREGWSRPRLAAARGRALAANAAAHAQHPAQLVRRAMRQALLHPWSRPLARAATRVGVDVDTSVVSRYPDTESAIAAALDAPRAPSKEPVHLRAYFQGGATLRRV